MNLRLPESLEELMDRLDLTLADDRHAQDWRLTARIGMAFCDQLIQSLNQEQRAGLIAARDNLNGKGSEAYRHWLNYFADRIDADQRSQVLKKQKALNRLVWAALNRNTGLSVHAAEFLSGLGEDAGLTVGQMATIFAEHISEL